MYKNIESKKQLKDCFLFRDDSLEFEHFEVIRTSGGYKVNVQNPVGALPLLLDTVDIVFWSVISSSHLVAYFFSTKYALHNLL